MACFKQRFARVIAIGGMMLLPAVPMLAQSVPERVRGPRQTVAPAAPAVPAAPSPAQAAPAAQPAASQPPQSAAPLAQPVSMLQQPAQEAQIAFADNRLSIQAENASLTSILRQVATRSGMRITGLGNDERVFGTFGPGAPRDVLADLLNGTAYNLVLLGDLTNGAPRELILTPATHGGEAPAPSRQATPDEAISEQETPEVNTPPDVPPPLPSTPPNPGVRTPQQLFEQLQQMRQAQQQQVNPQDSPPSPPPSPPQ